MSEPGGAPRTRLSTSMIVQRLDPRYFDTGTRGLIVVLFCLAIFAVVTAVLARAELRADRELAAARRAEIRRDAVEGAKSVDAVLTPVERAARALGDELGAGRLTDDQIKDKLLATLAAAPAEAVEVGVAFAPFAHRPDVNLYAPHCTRAAGP